MTVNLIHLLSLEMLLGFLRLSEFMIFWVDVTIKLMIDTDELTTLVYCFELVII